MPKQSKATTAKDTPKQEKPDGTGEGYHVLSTDLIDDPEQPIRSDLTPESVESLVLSIKQVGIIEPLIVKPNGRRFEVIAGHRRLYAAKLAKVVQVPCFVRKASGEETEMLKIHENLYREDINPSDEAKHFDYLIQKKGMSPSRIAQLISKSQTYVVDRLGILNYPPTLREAMEAKEISFSVAKEFAKFGDEKQMRSAIYYAKRSGMTQEMARKWVKDWEAAQQHREFQPTTSPDQTRGVEQIKHEATCIFCKKGLSLIEAEVVYMHPKCMREAQAITPDIDSESKDEG